jgi:hypothetical protein
MTLNAVNISDQFDHYPDSRMNQQDLDDWIESLLPLHSLRWIVWNVHVGLDRVRTVRNSHRTHIQRLHRLGQPQKATPEFRSRVIEIAIRFPALSDIQVAQRVHDESGVICLDQRLIGSSTLRLTRVKQLSAFLPGRRKSFQDAAAERTPRKWDDENDRQLWELVKQMGTKWKGIRRILGT